MGSGEGFAIEEYLTLSKDDALKKYGAHQTADDINSRFSFLSKPTSERARVTGVTYSMDRTPPERTPKMNMLTGRLFKDVSDKEIGKAILITDVYGILSYDPELSEALARYIKLLNPGGQIWWADSKGTQSMVQKADGTKVSLVDWLQNLPGIEVHDKNKAVQILVKTKSKVKIPKLKLTFSDGGSPPVRFFVEEP